MTSSTEEVDKPGSGVVAEESGELGTFCVYEADSPEAIRAHAEAADLPVDEIVPIADTVIVRPDPAPVSRLRPPLARPHMDVRTVLLGRETERARLSQAVERARRGTGSLVLLQSRGTSS